MDKDGAEDGLLMRVEERCTRHCSAPAVVSVDARRFVMDVMMKFFKLYQDFLEFHFSSARPDSSSCFLFS